jgi:uncharacterized protein (DUF342 family)
MTNAGQPPENPQDAATAVDGHFSLKVSDDKLSVTLTDLVPPSNGGAAVTLDAVLEELKAQKIVHGIDQDKIKLILAAVNGEETSSDQPDDAADEQRYCIASGTLAADGHDGELVWHFDEMALQNHACAAKPDELIATYKSATLGEPGKDVFGNAIAQTSGQNHFPRIGPGLTTTKTDEGDEYRAACYGMVKYETDESGELIDVENEIVVSDDGMEARMDIFGLTSAGHEVTCDDVVAALGAREVKHGIDQAAIQAALDKARNLSGPKGVACVRSVIVAVGTPPQEGKDARLIISRDDNSAGLELANGRMDYHERDYPWNVSKDEKIGYLLEAKPAVAGIPVYGGTIEVSQPKEIDVELDGVHKDDSGKLVADMDGALLINGYHLEVVELLVINGDVGPETGNIHSNIPVHVKGHVAPGFVLESKQDVIIEKNVEDATIHSGGMVIVKGGIRGMKSELFAPGDVDVGFIEHAAVFVNGNLNVKGSIMNSTVASNASIIVGGKKARKSVLVGGEVTAHNSLEALVLGTPAYAKTHIRLGMAQEQRREINTLDKSIETRQEEIKQLDQIEAHHKHYPKDDTAEVLPKIVATREAKQTEIAEFEQKKSELLAQLKEADSIKVVVHKCVYPGVTVTINEASYEVSKELGSGTFYFDKESNKVAFQPS